VKLAEKNSKVSEIGAVTASDNSGTAQAVVVRAKENVKALEVRLKQATLNFERQSALLADNATPKQVFDNAKSDKEAAESQLKAAQAEVNVLVQQVRVAQKGILSAKSQTGVAVQNIVTARLGVEQARTALANAKLQHSYTVIKAPTSGIVSDKNVQIGQVVAVGQPLMKVADASNMWVVANYKETQVGQMKVGAPAEVLVDAYPDKAFKAKVSSLSPATGARFALLPPDNATGNFVKVTQRIPVKITFVEPIDASTPLRAGMSVSVTVK
jgi:membrane fusion protein (multidrug efflux system)